MTINYIFDNYQGMINSMFLTFIYGTEETLKISLGVVVLK